MSTTLYDSIAILLSYLDILFQRQVKVLQYIDLGPFLQFEPNIFLEQHIPAYCWPRRINPLYLHFVSEDDALLKFFACTGETTSRRTIAMVIISLKKIIFVGNIINLINNLRLVIFVCFLHNYFDFF